MKYEFEVYCFSLLWAKLKGKVRSRKVYQYQKFLACIVLTGYSFELVARRVLLIKFSTWILASREGVIHPFMFQIKRGSSLGEGDTSVEEKGRESQGNEFQEEMLTHSVAHVLEITRGSLAVTVKSNLQRTRMYAPKN